MLTDLQQKIALALKRRKNLCTINSIERDIVSLLVYDIADIFTHYHKEVFDRKGFMEASGELEELKSLFDSLNNNPQLRG